MNFVNNWLRPITLAAGATSLALDIPPGNYRLTLADSATAPTRWEIVDAAVLNGEVTLIRGQEGTADQDWPAGSVIYNAVTAGVMELVLQLMTQFDQRIRALEGGGAAENQLSDSTGQPMTDSQGNPLTLSAAEENA